MAIMSSKSGQEAVGSKRAAARRRRKARGETAQRRTPPGTPPGTIIVDPESPKPTITFLAYGFDCLVEKTVQSVDEIPAAIKENPQCKVFWINVDGLGDAKAIARLGEIFHLHRLALEDVVNLHQRPKVEPYDDQLYIVTRMIELRPEFDQEQVSMFLGKNWVLTFLEDPGDCFERIRHRIRTKGGRIREAAADYLAYALLDSVIDSYFPVLEAYGERIEAVEGHILDRPEVRQVEQLHRIKRELLAFRRIAWPARESINALHRDESGLISPETKIYLRDLYDHAVQVLDLLETYRELASSQVDLYLSMLGQKTNETMKLLTMIGTIFLPLSFIAAVYGMNFVHGEEHPLNMPELEWPFGYLAVLAVMAAVASVMLVYFRRKGWIGSKRTRQTTEDQNAEPGAHENSPRGGDMRRPPS